MYRMNAKLMAALLTLAFGTPALADGLARRQVHQQQRIAQGIRSGELTAAEAARLEAKEARVHRQIVRDRVDGGGMTAQERAKAHAKLNQSSRQIYRQKHDAQDRR